MADIQATAYVVFFSRSPAITVRAFLDEGVPTVTQGYGGWKETERARRTSLTLFQGRPPYKMEVPILFDDFISDLSVENAIAKLEKLAIPPEGKFEPPKVRLEGAVPHQALTWVIDTIVWAEALRNKYGMRIRQRGVVTLIQYVGEDRTPFSPAAGSRSKTGAAGQPEPKGATSRGKSSTRTVSESRFGVEITRDAGASRLYVVKEGESIPRIAAEQLGDFRRAREIADMNDIRDTVVGLPVGTSIRIPIS